MIWHLLVAMISLSPYQISAEWTDPFWGMRFIFIQKMPSQLSYRLISLTMRVSLFFIKISPILLPKAQDYRIKHLWCAFKLNINRMLSGTLAISLLESMLHTMSHNMKFSYYLWLSQGTNGDTVSNTLGTGRRHGVLTFPIRCFSCLDDHIKWDNGKYRLFCQMGQGCQPWGPAHHHHDRLQPGTNQCSGNSVSIEPDLSVPLAQAPGNAIAFCNNRIWCALAKN